MCICPHGEQAAKERPSTATVHVVVRCWKKPVYHRLNAPRVKCGVLKGIFPKIQNFLENELMLKTYIPPALLDELKEAFPNRLPDSHFWLDDTNNVTLQKLAFQSGFQECISYLEEQVKLQKESSSDDLKIL